MGNHALFIGYTEISSRIESTLESPVVVKETTTEGVSYLDSTDRSPDCVVTGHDPPAVDCFELLEAVSSELPVVVAPTGGSSKLATHALRVGAATYVDCSTVDDEADAIGAAVERATDTERLEAFSSLVAHELRSPIQTAQSGLDLAKAECDSTYLDEVDRTISQLDQLIDNLLDQLTQRETTVELEPVDLAVVVEDAWPAETTATLSVESDLPTVEAEPSRLRQLFKNLFRNSVEHGSTDNRPQGGNSIEQGSTDSRAEPDDNGETVTVRVGVSNPADSESDSIGLYIADDGPGIDRDRRENVFEYGYTSSEDGTGFGLAIVDDVVEAFDWEITLTESQTGGARFELHNMKNV